MSTNVSAGNSTATGVAFGSLAIIQIVQLTTEGTIAVVAVSGNSLTIAVVLLNRAMRKPTNILIVSLAVTDFLVGAIAIPFSLVSANGFPKDDFSGCLIINSLIVCFTQVSIFGLFAISIERFVAVRFPLRYRSLCNSRTLLLVCALAWTSGLLVGNVPLMGWNLGAPADGHCSFVAIIDMKYMVYFNFFACVLTPLVAVGCIYGYIFRILMKTGRAVGTGGEAKSSAGERRAARSLALVVLMFAVCWLPLHIINTLGLLCRGLSIPFELVVFAILLSHANSAVNPFIYVFSNSQFRAAYRQLLLCHKCRGLPPIGLGPETTGG